MKVAVWRVCLFITALAVSSIVPDKKLGHPHYARLCQTTTVSLFHSGRGISIHVKI